MKAKLLVAILVVPTAVLFTGYCGKVRAQQVQRVKNPISGSYSGKTDCIDLEKELNSLTSRECDLMTALTPERLHLARLASITGLNSAEAAELSSRLARARREKRAVLQVMEAKGCR